MNVKQFLLTHKQSSQNVSIEESLTLFLEEMSSGLEGRGSLAMIATYLYETDKSAALAGGKKIVIDAGGTNFRSALAYFNQAGEAKIENIKKTFMPATEKEYSKQEFYSAIANNVERLLPEGGDIGFCFSYPVDMEADKDGLIVSASKGVKAPEIIGTKVGKCTLEAIKQLNSKPRRIVILNDTVATLLGGMATSNKKYSAYIGYIFGTGTNLCYLENTENIHKPNLERGRRMIVNSECGNFNKFVQGDYDKKVALATGQPERQKFEKMTSGKYLSEVIYECILGAKEEGVFKGKTSPAPFDLKEVSALLEGENNCIQGAFPLEEDLLAVKEICTNLVDRAAKTGAIANAAAAIRSYRGDGLPVAIVAEGTTFNKLYGFRERFEGYLKEILSARGISFEIVQGEELNLVGALLATTA